MSSPETEDSSPISVAAPPAPPVDDRPSKLTGARVAMFVVPALLVGAGVGFLVGAHFGSERVKDEYRNPLVEVKAAPRSGAVVVASGSASADPSPPVGTKVLAPFPLAAARKALSGLTGNDKVIVTVGSVGRSDEGKELHLALMNRGDCTLKTVSGVAYGFDPDGESAIMNADGRHYVAFASNELSIAPGETSITNFKVHHPRHANIVLAQVDRAVCDDGRVLKSR